MPKILNIRKVGKHGRILLWYWNTSQWGEFEARVEGLTPNVMSLKSDNLEELLEQLTIELEDKLN